MKGRCGHYFGLRISPLAALSVLGLLLAVACFFFIHRHHLYGRIIFPSSF